MAEYSKWREADSDEADISMFTIGAMGALSNVLYRIMLLINETDEEYYIRWQHDETGRKVDLLMGFPPEDRGKWTRIGRTDEFLDETN